jgi:hypothetical protein
MVAVDDAEWQGRAEARDPCDGGPPAHPRQVDTLDAAWRPIVNRDTGSRGLRLLAVGALLVGLAPGMALAQSPSSQPASSAPASTAVSTWPCTGWKPVPALATTPDPSASPSPPPVLPAAVPMKEAWGDVPVQAVRTDLGHGRRFLFEGVATSDGRWLIGTTLHERRDPGAAKGPDDLVMVRVSDGVVRTIARLTTADPSLSIVSDGRWVVWAESGEDVMTDPVRMRVYDRDTGSVRDIARSLHHPGGRLVGILSLDGDRLVWAQQTGKPLNGPDRHAAAELHEMDLSTGMVRTLAEGAGFPVMAGPWLGWAATALMDDGEPMTLTITNDQTGQQVQVDVPYPSLRLHGASAVFTTGASGYDIVCIVDDLTTGGPARPILADPDASFEWLSVNDRAVGFAQQTLGSGLGKDPTQVYDRQLEVLVDLPMTVGSNQTWAAGPLVVWATPTKHGDDFPESMRVVDTRDIKSQPRRPGRGAMASGPVH